MALAHLISRPWLSTCVLLVFPLAREASGWLIPPGRLAPVRPSTIASCFEVESGVSPPQSSKRCPRLPATLASGGRRRSIGRVASDANGEGGAENSSSASSSESGAGVTAAAAAGESQQQRVQAAEDTDAPILYIKGLNEGGGGGGVGIWGDSGGGNVAEGEGNAARVAKAMQTIESGREDAGEEDVGGGGDGTPLWDRVQMSLGLGVWSYVGLGLALFIILLNNWLGVGWLNRALTQDFDTEGMVDIDRRTQQIQVMPLNDASNLLSP